MKSDEKLRATLRARLTDLGISAREASRRAGFNVGYVGNILERPGLMPERERILRLAEVLQFDPRDILSDSPAVIGMPEGRHVAELFPLGVDPRQGGRMIPLFAAPLPIAAPFVAFSDSPIGKVPCPAPLLGNPDAYAVTVPNNSVAPRYMGGETVFLSPGETPRPGDFVFVRLEAGDAGIARLAEIGRESVRLEFIGLEGCEAAAETAFNDMAAMHRIIASIVA